MVIVAIGALITSTFSSLLVIPLIFKFVDDAMQWLLPRLHRPQVRAASRGERAGGGGAAKLSTS